MNTPSIVNKPQSIALEKSMEEFQLNYQQHILILPIASILHTLI